MLDGQHPLSRKPPSDDCLHVLFGVGTKNCRRRCSENVSLSKPRSMRAMAPGAANYRLPHLFPESVHAVLARDAVFAVHDHLVRNLPEQPGHSFCRVVIPGRRNRRCGILSQGWLYVESSLSL